MNAEEIYELLAFKLQNFEKWFPDDVRTSFDGVLSDLARQIDRDKQAQQDTLSALQMECYRIACELEGQVMPREVA